MNKNQSESPPQASCAESTMVAAINHWCLNNLFPLDLEPTDQPETYAEMLVRNTEAVGTTLDHATAFAFANQGRIVFSISMDIKEWEKHCKAKFDSEYYDPERRELGDIVNNLKIDNTLEYYDGIILALVTSKEKRYFMYATGDDIYLLIETDDGMIKRYMEGEMSLLEVIQSREWVIAVKWEELGGDPRKMYLDEIPAAWLPAPDYYNQ